MDIFRNRSNKLLLKFKNRGKRKEVVEGRGKEEIEEILVVCWMKRVLQ